MSLGISSPSSEQRSDDVFITAIAITAPVLLASVSVATVWSLLRAVSRPIRAIYVPTLCAIITTAFIRLLPPIAEDFLNHARIPMLPEHQRNAETYHQRFPVADLHCDALLWGARDFLKTTFYPFVHNRPVGHTDLPRLKQGNVTLQVLAIVNSVPFGSNFDHNSKPASAWSDALFLKTILERWSPSTWFSPKARVLYQISSLRSLVLRANGALTVIESSKDMSFVHTKTSPKYSLHTIMAVEGLSSLEGDISVIDIFFSQGVRILGLVHMFDNEVGGSLSGEKGGGLTMFGRLVIQRMNKLGMIVDLAHASVSLMKDILGLPDSQRPKIMLSHTGLTSVCGGSRNLDDEYMRWIAAHKGIIGITLFEPAQCGGDIVSSFVKSVIHAKRVLGDLSAIALGTDWDGAVKTSISAADTHILSAALLTSNQLSSDQVHDVMFRNSLAFFSRSLPSSEPA